MARIETDPNYTIPTFSRATAPTDLFKATDVQGLAAAMSTHNHDGAGKGLVLAAGTITGSMIAAGTITATNILTGTIDNSKLQDGTIESNKIKDGTIVTGDMADGSVTSFVNAGGFISPSTTSTSPVLIPSLVTPSMSVQGGRAILVSGHITVQYSSVSNCNLFLYRDSTQLGALAIAQSASASQILPLAFTYMDNGATAGAHTWSLYWSTSGPSISLVGAAYSEIWAMDIKR